MSVLRPTQIDFGKLLESGRGGDSHALGDLFAYFRPYLLAVAERELEPELRAKGGASDKVQDAFVEAREILANFEGTTEGEFRAWLRAVLLNKLRDFRHRYFRAGSRDVSRERSIDGMPYDSIADDNSSPSMKAGRIEESVLLAEAIARMPDDYRMVIRLRNWEDRTFTDIGGMMGRSEDAARMLWGRAVERLQWELEHPP